MRRKTFDALLTTGGLLIAAVLLIAGGLLTWAHSFVDSQVKTQLSQQQIFFPKAGDPQLKEAQIGPYLSKYAGQQLTNGAQAEAYADHFIAVHLEGIGGGKTYAQLSTQAQANPTDTKLAATVNTMFKGETLRGLLLTSYGFSIFGDRAQLAADLCYAVALVLLIATVAGFLHAAGRSSRHQILTPTREP